jgi:hypothetical protein
MIEGDLREKGSRRIWNILVSLCVTLVCLAGLGWYFFAPDPLAELSQAVFWFEANRTEIDEIERACDVEIEYSGTLHPGLIQDRLEVRIDVIPLRKTSEPVRAIESLRELIPPLPLQVTFQDGNSSHHFEHTNTELIRQMQEKLE